MLQVALIIQLMLLDEMQFRCFWRGAILPYHEAFRRRIVQDFESIPKLLRLGYEALIALRIASA